MLGAGALGGPRGMVWGGRREEGSGWGTHVCLWRIHFDIWQNEYNIVKFKNKIKFKKKSLVFWGSGSPVWGLRGPSEMSNLGSGKVFSMGPFVSSWERSAILELQGLQCIMENRGYNSTQKKDSGKWASEAGTSAFPQQHRCSPPRLGDIGNIWSWIGARWVPFDAENISVHEMCGITEGSWVFSGWKRGKVTAYTTKIITIVIVQFA